jgi:hypothetical protein
VRGGNHPDYSRLVFDWPRGVDFTINQTGTLLTVRFSRPGKADFTQARGGTGPRVTALTQLPGSDSMTVTFVTPPNAVLRQFKSGTSVVIDIRDPVGASAKPAASQTAETPPARAAQPPATQPPTAQPPATQPPAGQPPAGQPPAGQPAANRPGGAAAVPSGRPPANAPLYQLRSTPAATPVQTPPPAAAAPATGAPTPLLPSPLLPSPPAGSAPAASPVPVPATGTSTAAVLPAGTPAAPPAAALPAAGPPSAVPATPQPAGPIPGVPPGAASAPPAIASPTLPPSAETATASTPAIYEPLSFVFDPKIEAAVAVYERAGFLYVLFDRPIPPETAPQVNAPELIGTIEPVDVPDGGGFRFATALVLDPVVARDGTGWRITLRRPGEAPMDSLKVEPDLGFALGPRLLVKVEDVERVIDFKDPVVGDEIKVIPLLTPGQRIAMALRYPEVSLLATAQGIVVKPLDERLLVQPVRDGLELTVPGGLRLSSAQDAASVIPPPPPPAAEEEKLFDYRRWGATESSNKFIAERQKRWKTLIDHDKGERSRDRLNIARFYVANGLGAEAIGALDLVVQQQPDMERRPELRAVRGAARVLAGDRPTVRLPGEKKADSGRDALADLNHRSLDNEPDAAVWKAAAYAARNNWGESYRNFAANLDLLMGFPNPLFTRLGLLATEAALKSNDTAMAAKLLKRLGTGEAASEGLNAAAIKYFQGELARQQGDLNKAKQIWGPLETDRNLLYRTLAQRDMTQLRLDTKQVDGKVAAKQMERLRFAWRGDDLELDLQRKIIDTHIAAQNYPQAFDTLRRTISLFKDHPVAPQLTKQLSDTFTDLFARDGAAHMPPLEALSLYERYRELTPLPPDPKGDLIVRRLADRMVELDLLDRAAGLLEQQVKERLVGLEKAQIGTKLAGIRLLDHQPELAIKALDMSEVAGIPPELAAERRLLRARALSETKRGSQAVQLLSQDRSRESNLLRVDIAWREKQWQSAAQAIADLVGPPPPAGQALDPAVAKLVINRAVALSLAQDTAALARLRDEFGPAMEQSREATTFRVLTRPQDAAGLVDAASLQSRMKEIDMFKSFLDGYRAKQVDPAPAAPAAAPAAPAAAPAATN